MSEVATEALRKVPTPPTIKYVEATFKLHLFSTQIEDKTILYQVILMKDSLMIFINYENERVLNDMSVAMSTPSSKGAIASKLFGNFMDESSQALAAKVSKKLNKPVYLSCNIEYDRLTSVAVERQLFQEIKDHPEKF